MKDAQTTTDIATRQADAFVVSPQVTEGVAKNDGALAKLKDAKTGALVIRTIDGEQEAHRLLTQYQDYGDAIALERDTALRPLLDAEKTIRERAKVHLAPIGVACDLLEAAIKENNKWKRDEAQRVQDEINKAHEKELRKEEKRADKKGEVPKPIAPPPIVAEPEKTVVVGDAKRTFVDHWVAGVEGVAAGKEAELTVANFPEEFVKKHKQLFKLDWKTVAATIRAGKGTNPYGSPITVMNEPILSTKKV